MRLRDMSKPTTVKPTWRWEQKAKSSPPFLSCEATGAGILAGWESGWALVDSKGDAARGGALEDATAAGASGDALLVLLGSEEARRLIAIDVQRQKVRWEHEVPTSAWAELAVVEGCAIVNSIDRALSAFDVATGERLWSREHGEGKNFGDARRFGSWCQLFGHDEKTGHVCELIDPRTGKVAWRSPRGFLARTSNDHALFGVTDSELVALDRKGKPAWRTTPADLANVAMACDDQVLVTFDSRQHNLPVGLNAYAAATGKHLWRVELKNAPGPARTPCLARGRVWVIDGSKTLHAFDAASGALHSKVPLPSVKLDHALVSGDDVVAYNRNEGTQPMLIGFAGLA